MEEFKTHIETTIVILSLLADMTEEIRKYEPLSHQHLLLQEFVDQYEAIRQLKRGKVRNFIESTLKELEILKK